MLVIAAESFNLGMNANSTRSCCTKNPDVSGCFAVFDLVWNGNWSVLFIISFGALQNTNIWFTRKSRGNINMNSLEFLIQTAFIYQTFKATSVIQMLVLYFGMWKSYAGIWQKFKTLYRKMKKKVLCIFSHFTAPFLKSHITLIFNEWPE